MGAILCGCNSTSIVKMIKKNTVSVLQNVTIEFVIIDIICQLKSLLEKGALCIMSFLKNKLFDPKNSIIVLGIKNG